MFSGDVLVRLANGSKKQISQLKRTDKVLNKLNRPVGVRRIHTFPNSTAVKISLDNGTPDFICSPSTLVYARYINEQGIHTVEFMSIEEVHAKNGKIKSTLRMFSPESDVSILSYTPEPEPMTLYALELVDTTRSYFVNDMIVGY